MTYTIEMLALKVKIMLQKIDKLRKVYMLIQTETNCKEISALEIIKQQYLRMYNQLIEEGKYERYKEIEDIVIKEIAKIEMQLDKHINATSKNCKEIIIHNIQEIRASENYQNYQNMENEYNRVEGLKELLKLYGPYITQREEEELKDEVIQLKFDVLFRKQVEELIYQNVSTNNNLSQYDSKVEKDMFKKLLGEKINSISSEKEKTNISIEQILNDRGLLERLIIIHIKKNPYEYINLLNAKIFNAHLCNIGNNPFEKEVYIPEEQLDERASRYSKIWDRGKKNKGLKADKVNYSLLESILRNVITDEDISIIECENLYKKFGFECRPILTNIGQECVEMIFHDIRRSQEFADFLQKSEKNRKSQDGNYCEIDFKGLIYKFDNEEKEYTFELIKGFMHEFKREIKEKRFFSKKQELPKQKDYLQEEKEEIKNSGTITTDRNIIILLIKDIIDIYNNKIQKTKQELEEMPLEEDGFVWDYVKDSKREDCEFNINRYEAIVKKSKENIKWLEELNGINRKLTLEEVKKLLRIINDTYKVLGIKYNVREVIPLEDMSIERGQVDLAPIPEEYRNHLIEVSHSFIGGSKYERRSYHVYNLEPLWKKYQKEFKELGIDIKKYCIGYNWQPHFEICVNLDDISDLPIDYTKVKLVTKEKLKEISEREEGDVR